MKTFKKLAEEVASHINTEGYVTRTGLFGNIMWKRVRAGSGSHQGGSAKPSEHLKSIGMFAKRGNTVVIEGTPGNYIYTSIVKVVPDIL